MRWRRLIVHLAQTSHMLESRHAHEHIAIRAIHAKRDLDRLS
jgi:hypothetical protein